MKKFPNLYGLIFYKIFEVKGGRIEDLHTIVSWEAILTCPSVVDVDPITAEGMVIWQR